MRRVFFEKYPSSAKIKYFSLNSFPLWRGHLVASVIYNKYSAVFSYIISSVYWEFDNG